MRHLQSAPTRRRLFTTILLSLSGLLTVVVLGLSVTLTVGYERNARNLLEDASAQILAHVGHTLATFDDSARAMAVALLATNPVVQLMHSSGLELWEAMKTLDTIKARIQSESLIHSVYVYNRDDDRFYSTAGRGMQPRAEFFDPWVAEMVDSPGSVERLRPVARRIPAGVSSTQADLVNVYTYVLYDGLRRPERLPSCIIVNVDVRYLMETVHSLSLSASRGSASAAETTILDSSGRVMGNLDDGLFLADLSDDPRYSRLGAGAQGSFVVAWGKERLLITFISLPRLGWKLVREEPYRAAIRPILTHRLLMLLVAAVFLFFGVGLAVLFSFRLYSPIGKLVRDVRRLLGAPRSGDQTPNELLFLAQAFSQTARSADMLRRFKESNLRLLREELLRSLLTSYERDGTELERKLHELELRLDPQGWYRMALFHIERPPVGSGEQGSGGVYELALAQMLRGLLEEAVSDGVQLEGGRLAVLLHADGPEAEPGAGPLPDTLGEVRQAQRRVRQSLGICLSAALSSPGRGLSALPSLVRQAQDILCYKFFHGGGCALGPWDLPGPGASPATFPVELEVELLGRLREADAEGAAAAYRDLLRSLSPSTYEGMVLCLNRLCASIFDLLGAIENNSGLRFDVRFSQFSRTLADSQTQEAASAAFLSLFEHIARRQRSVVTDKTRRHVELVKEIVAARYSDPGLCANGIADSMRMSAVYLGKIFRDSCSCSIAEHITRLRLERARELLESTNKTVKAISREVGIERARFFFTKFRECFGTTPSEYRVRKLAPTKPSAA